MPSEIRKRLTLAPPKNYKVGNALDTIRDAIITAGEIIETTGCPGRELSLAFTKLEEACSWAIASVVRNQDQFPS